MRLTDREIAELNNSTHSGRLREAAYQQAKARAISAGDLAAHSGPRDWIYDYWHDGGTYRSRCTNCQKLFLGFAWRHKCRVCGPPSQGGDSK